MSTDMPCVLRYRVKPEATLKDGTTVRLRGGTFAAARYEPGRPLDALEAVAAMADHRAELAEARLPSETVLVVGWTGPPSWVVIRPGQHLASSDDRALLYCTDDDTLRERCDLMPGGQVISS